MRSRLWYTAIAAIVLTAANGGCGSLSLVRDSNVLPPAQRGRGAHSAFKGSLYVVSAINAQGGDEAVLLYPPGGAAHSAEFLPGPRSGATRAIAFDRSANVYFANDTNDVTVFRPGQTWPSRYIGWGIDQPDALAFDATGNLYVLNCPGCTGLVPPAASISVYKPGKTLPARTIVKGLSSYPWAMAMSRGGTLYVANCPSCDLSNGLGKHSAGNVVAYKLGASAPSLKITKGIAGPSALTFDSAGNLYVANIGASATQSFISVFPPGKTTPSLTISAGLDHPLALAVDSSNDVFVANEVGIGSSSVTEYAPGTTAPELTISTPGVPVMLATDASGNLYVANQMNDSSNPYAYGTVLVYAPGSSTPTVAIDDNILVPVAIGISP
jgi:hypothetical protein